MRSSFATLSLGLWDEEEQRLISFREAHSSYEMCMPKGRRNVVISKNR